MRVPIGPCWPLRTVEPGAESPAGAGVMGLQVCVCVCACVCVRLPVQHSPTQQLSPDLRDLPVT